MKLKENEKGIRQNIITYFVSSSPYIEICQVVKSMEGEAEASLPYI